MINGYEYLYQEEKGKKPKYELHTAKDTEHFAHDIDGSGKTSHLGVTGCEAYTNLIEQNIGKDFYDNLLKLYGNYEDLYRTIKDYQEHKLEFDRLSVKLKKAKTNFKNIEMRKARIQTSINNVMKSKDLHKAESLQSLAEELKEVEVEVDLLKNELNKVEEEYNKIETRVNNEYEKIKELKNQLQKDKENLDTEKLDELRKKFNDKNFQMQLEQEFLDTLLLPNEHKKEGGVRYVAQTWFIAFKNEAKYLTSIKPVIESLIANINKQYSDNKLKDIFIDDKVSAQYKITQGMKNLTTDIIENSKGRFDSKKFCEFYQEAMQMIKASEYGKSPSTELYNLPEFAMQKYKYKTDKVRKPDQDLDSAEEIFDGVTKLIEGNVILSSEQSLSAK